MTARGARGAMTERGRFITVEGIDGAGKSSHLEHLRARVAARGVGVEVTREPGGTPLGEKLREVVLRHPAPALAEALVMFAARSAHLDGLIAPALGAGRWVLCDRFSDSTYAYQCGGRGLPREAVEALERIVHPALQPDATFLFDLEPAAALARQRGRGGASDRFEREAQDFFGRVREAYLERARAHPDRIQVIDASGTLEQVRARLDAAFDRALP